MMPTKNLSSLEKLLLGIDQPEAVEITAPHRKGDLCPVCKIEKLDYNGLLQLECPACGFAESGEGIGCT